MKHFYFPNKPNRIFDLSVFLESIKKDIFDWVVQPKFDGHRALVYCDEDGHIEIFSRLGKKLTLGKGKFKWLSCLEIPRPFLLDCELTRTNVLIAWDFALCGGETKFHLTYGERLRMLEPISVSKGDESFRVIQTLPANDYKSIFLRKADPLIEGMVFKRLSAKDCWGPYKTSDVGSMVKFKFK